MSATTCYQYGSRCLRIALTALAALSWSAAYAQTVEPANRTDHISAHHLTVTGRGEVMVQPDHANIVIGVVTEDRSSRAAASDNTTNTRKVENAIMHAGVLPMDIQTFNYSVQPVYSSEKTPLAGVPAPLIVAYRVSNQMRVTVHNLSRIGEILDAATAAGSNTVENIAFGQKDQAPAEDEALHRAIANARRKADQIAIAAGVRIVGIDEINEGSVQRPFPILYSRASVAEATSTPILAGESTVTANVTIVYEVSSTTQSFNTRTDKAMARKP